MKIYEALAQAFIGEQVDTCFALLGDANMHWAGALADRGVKFIYPRHEHAAVAGATAYARVTNKVGCATVTCGPGLTQIMTILPIAVRARIPLVIFAGEAPLHKAWYNQGIDQAPFVTACGARYRSLHDPAQIVAEIHDAFAEAKKNHIPVVVGVPFDLQQLPFEGQLDHPLSNDLLAKAKNPNPDPELIATATEWLNASQHPIVLAGLGTVNADARKACIELAERSGALLATTLPAKGLFHDQDFCLGVAGGFATERSKEIFAKSDLVIGVGTRLASHAFDGGKLTPNARVIHIDVNPQEVVQGRRAADLLIKSDARLGAEALLESVSSKNGWRSQEMQKTTKQALQLPEDCETPDGFLHPMAVVKRLAATISPSCHIVNTSGHCAYYAAQMNSHPQSHFTVIREFGAIGNGTSFALGIAAAHPDRPIILIDGDGSALMHIQELETMKRHNQKVLTIVLNDGAYGSEVHKLRADRVSYEGSVFGRPDIAAVGRGFGLAGSTIAKLGDIKRLFDQFLSSDGPAIWDVHISDQIASPQILKAHTAGHL